MSTQGLHTIELCDSEVDVQQWWQRCFKVIPIIQILNIKQWTETPLFPPSVSPKLPCKYMYPAPQVSHRCAGFWNIPIWTQKITHWAQSWQMFTIKDHFWPNAMLNTWTEQNQIHFHCIYLWIKKPIDVKGIYLRQHLHEPIITNGSKNCAKAKMWVFVSVCPSWKLVWKGMEEKSPPGKEDVSSQEQYLFPSHYTSKEKIKEYSARGIIYSSIPFLKEVPK